MGSVKCLAKGQVTKLSLLTVNWCLCFTHLQRKVKSILYPCVFLPDVIRCCERHASLHRHLKDMANNKQTFSFEV